ncbi:MAG: hypothetical protein NTU45_00355 [Planctomycetota bacterium]|nr:hypothetical protein [Planctomycetota bacterium]
MMKRIADGTSHQTDSPSSVVHCSTCDSISWLVRAASAIERSNQMCATGVATNAHTTAVHAASSVPRPAS